MTSPVMRKCALEVGKTDATAFNIVARSMQDLKIPLFLNNSPGCDTDYMVYFRIHEIGWNGKSALCTYPSIAEGKFTGKPHLTAIIASVTIFSSVLTTRTTVFYCIFWAPAFIITTRAISATKISSMCRPNLLSVIFGIFYYTFSQAFLIFFRVGGPPLISVFSDFIRVSFTPLAIFFRAVRSRTHVLIIASTNFLSVFGGIRIRVLASTFLSTQAYPIFSLCRLSADSAGSHRASTVLAFPRFSLRQLSADGAGCGLGTCGRLAHSRTPFPVRPGRCAEPRGRAALNSTGGVLCG